MFTLLFIGDSITDMKWGRNEKDRNHYLGHSYVYLIASRLGVDMPEAKLEFFNRGHSGNRLVDIKSRWQKDVIEMKPDLLSVLVGVNDRIIQFGPGFLCAGIAGPLPARWVWANRPTSQDSSGSRH